MGINFHFIDGAELPDGVRKQLEGSTILNLQGHLFDSGLINQVLNQVEERGGRFSIVECNVAPNWNSQSGPEQFVSSALLQITMDGGREELDETIAAVTNLASVIPGANAEVSELKGYCEGQFSKTLRATE